MFFTQHKNYMCSVSSYIIWLFETLGGLQSDDGTTAWVEWGMEKWGKHREDRRLNFQEVLNQQGSHKGKRTELFSFWFDVSNWLLRGTSHWMHRTHPCDHPAWKTRVSPDSSLCQMPRVTVFAEYLTISHWDRCKRLLLPGLPFSDLPSNLLSASLLKCTPDCFVLCRCFSPFSIKSLCVVAWGSFITWLFFAFASLPLPVPPSPCSLAVSTPTTLNALYFSKHNSLSCVFMSFLILWSLPRMPSLIMNTCFLFLFSPNVFYKHCPF